MSESEYRDIAVSVGHDINRNVALTLWTDIVAGEAVRVTLSPYRAAALLRDLTAQTTFALTDAVMNVARGDCATCQNTRMVATVVSGRESNAYCPDCRVETDRDGFPFRPQIGGGLA